MFITSVISAAINDCPLILSASTLPLNHLARPAYYLKNNEGNAIFSNGEELYVPECILGNVNDLELGNHAVFADNGKLFPGLKKFVFGYTKSNLPIFICDNHNFVVDAWQLLKGAKMIHIDQHRDEAKCKGDETTSSQLLVCNYIDYAIKNEIIDPNFISFTESSDLVKLPLINNFSNHIVNLDLDIFDPECTVLSLHEKMQIIVNSCQNAALLTMATSPGFIDQKRAIAIAKAIWENL
ncbi:MAG: hypothetical protein ACRC37_07565 [Lentisphaeria bacterium]